MAFLGFREDIEETLPAGTYFEVTDTGEVFDSENDLEEYNMVWLPDDFEEDTYFTSEEIEEAGLDEDDGEWGQQDFTVDTFTIEPLYVTLQNDAVGYEEFVWAYNINRGFDSIPPDMVGKVHEFDTLDEAIEEANTMAQRLSKEAKYKDEPIGVTLSTAEVYGDIDEVYMNGREI